MPIILFGRFLHDNSKIIDTSLFVQKPYLRTNFLESSIEEDIDLKNRERSKNLPDINSIREAISKSYVDNSFNDSSISKNTEQIDLNNRNKTRR